jgi:hypothetical protein
LGLPRSGGVPVFLCAPLGGFAQNEEGSILEKPCGFHRAQGYVQDGGSPCQGYDSTRHTNRQIDVGLSREEREKESCGTTPGLILSC